MPVAAVAWGRGRRDFGRGQGAEQSLRGCVGRKRAWCCEVFQIEPKGKKIKKGGKKGMSKDLDVLGPTCDRRTASENDACENEIVVLRRITTSLCVVL